MQMQHAVDHPRDNFAVIYHSSFPFAKEIALNTAWEGWAIHATEGSDIQGQKLPWSLFQAQQIHIIQDFQCSEWFLALTATCHRT